MRPDIAVGLAAAVVGALFAYQATQLQLFREGTAGPGLYPLVVASTLVGCGLLLITMSLVKHHRDGATGASKGASTGRVGNSASHGGTDESERSEEITDRPVRRFQRIGRSTMVWVAIAIGVGLLDIIGFYLAMMLLVALLLFGVERRYTVGSVFAVVLIPAAAYLVFGTTLGLNLPAGPLGL